MKNLIAHRGLKENAKENTMNAFKNSLNDPDYIGFECDIRTTKDHVFVICHNPMIKNDIISLTDYKVLKEKYQIPTLEEVLNLKSDKIFLLEIKEHNIDINAFLKILEKRKEKNIYIMSFFNSVIKKLKKANCPFKLGVLNYVFNSENTYEDYDFICLLESVITKDLVKYFKNKKIEIFIYGIHHLNSLISIYQDCYFITDDII